MGFCPDPPEGPQGPPISPLYLVLGQSIGNGRILGVAQSYIFRLWGEGEAGPKAEWGQNTD